MPSEIAGVGTSLVTVVVQSERKVVKAMKIATSFLAAVLLAGSVGASNSFAFEDGVVSDTTLSSDSYCHLRFPAIDPDTLSSDHPALDQGGEMIDFYGSCDEDPLGMDQILHQKQEAQYRWRYEYEH